MFTGGTARALAEHLESMPFRPMFKFQFLRTTDPGTSPSWDHDPSAQDSLASFEELAGEELQVHWRDLPGNAFLSSPGLWQILLGPLADLI